MITGDKCLTSEKYSKYSHNRSSQLRDGLSESNRMSHSSKKANCASYLESYMSFSSHVLKRVFRPVECSKVISNRWQIPMAQLAN